MAEPSRQRPATIEPVAPARVLLVEGRFYDAINDGMLAGAKAALEAASASFDLVTMPGALEIPLALALCLDAAAAAGRPYDAAVALGCVVRGETYHFEIVCNDSCRGAMDVTLARKLPFGNGILTVENETQATERADPARGDKGGDAARAALALLRLKRVVEAR